MVNAIKEIDKVEEIKICFSSIIFRDDQNFHEDIKKINSKLKSFCEGKGLYFLDNENIDGSCLNRGRLHLNRKGTSMMKKNISNFINSI